MIRPQFRTHEMLLFHGSWSLRKPVFRRTNNNPSISRPHFDERPLTEERPSTNAHWQKKFPLSKVKISLNLNSLFFIDVIPSFNIRHSETKVKGWTDLKTTNVQFSRIYRTESLIRWVLKNIWFCPSVRMVVQVSRQIINREETRRIQFIQKASEASTMTDLCKLL